MDQDRIIDIIVKVLDRTATEKDKAYLDKWISQDPSHGELLDRLQERGYLAEQYAKWDAIDVQRPKLHMKKTVRPRSKAAAYAFGCATAFLSLALLLVLRTPGKDMKTPAAPEPGYIETIVPGQAMATLVQSDGASLDLKNEEFIWKTNPKQPSEKSLPGDSHPELETMACNILSVPRGGEFHIVLEDSTEVWLNADSSLEYPESFSADERRVKVNGEVYFKVHKDLSRPFYVTSAGQVVRVYGTEFSVSSYPEDSNVYTTLVSGKIGIFPESMSSSTLYLSPDHQAVFSKAEETITVDPVNSRIVTSWKDGMFVFEDQTLSQIMVQLSRWYDFKYEFADDEAPAIQFKGRIHRYSKFTDLLEILEKSGGIKFTARNDKIIISKI